MLTHFTDIHHHLVYGVDDGPESFLETEAMIWAACRDQIGRIIATSHVTPGIEMFDLDLFFRKLECIRAFCLRHQLELDVFEGAEILYTELTRKFLDERRVPTLAGSDYVLVEFLPDISYKEVWNAVENLNRGGYIPILAHVERYRCLVHRAQRAYHLKRSLNVRYQVNCSTIVHGKSFSVNRFCRRLLKDEMIDAVATDAHNVNLRPALMKTTYRVLEKQVGLQYTNYLTGADGGIIFR